MKASDKGWVVNYIGEIGMMTGKPSRLDPNMFFTFCGRVMPLDIRRMLILPDQKEYGVLNLLLVVSMHSSLELAQFFRGREVFSTHLVSGPRDLSESPRRD